ncbi:MAG: phosphoglycerate kinase [Verrucomicrobiales bacterium]|nr:phosphoglycerate kinase [Verrucomicrobiales bacterium]
MAKLSIRDLSPAGKRVLMRVDFNVPQDKDGNITDDTRIRAAIPSIEHLTKAGAKVILMSHLGRPKGEKNPEFSLLPVAKRLGELMGTDVHFVEDCVGAVADETVSNLGDGEILLLENVRFYKGETDNDPEFAAQLGKHGDIFVNDAFGTAHRAHASTEGVTHHIDQCAMGFLIEKELKFLVEELESPKSPFVVIMGGAKVSDKIKILERLMEKADAFIIGGAMANTFRLAQGYDIGKSFAERTDEAMELARGILKTAEDKNIGFHVAADTRYTREFAANAPTEVTAPWAEGGSVPADAEGIDIGDKAIEEFADIISKAGTVIWNGPMGVFEKEGFDIGTRAVGKAMADNSSALTIVGGGDSVTAANQFGFGDKMDHMSTGGGASLELLEGKDLPGIAAIDNV